MKSLCANFWDVLAKQFIVRNRFIFYLPHLVHKFAPWSILLIAIAIFNLASLRWRIGTAFREISPDTFWILCWSLGGLIMMSLIPSKRVDRIFPVIPPLCLPLAAQVSSGVGSLRRLDAPSRTAWRPYLATALVFAILFTGGHATWKVVTGYCDHRDALAIFGRNVPREAEARHWRHEAVSAKDEDLLLYLRKTYYIEPGRAIADWNGGNLDAIVASRERAPRLMPQLRGAIVSQLKSSDRKKEQGTGYILITP
jgi:hypothetical protein